MKGGGGGERGYNLKFLKKNRSKYLSAKLIILKNSR